MSHPVTPPSPAHSSNSLSSSADSDHSSDPHTSSHSSQISSSSSSSNYRPDRRSGRSKRIPLSATQKALLEEFFRTNHYPTRDEKTELGAKINLSSDKVHKWSLDRHNILHSTLLLYSVSHHVHSITNFLLLRCIVLCALRCVAPGTTIVARR